jgi:hypothetical protein
MKKFMTMMLGLSLVLGSATMFAQAPAQTDQPKAEKTKHKKAKTKKHSKAKAEQTKSAQ